ncbi:MAG TPA: hypothetical protein VFT82_03270 [Candidatus Paceibacterota bacterium]|nr:hypothetical protein [Candidatus Paceibacterota bacterium]
MPKKQPLWHSNIAVVSHIVSQKLALQRRMADEVLRIAEMEKKHSAALLDAVPPIAREFVEETDVIRHLFECGYSRGAVNIGECGVQSFEDGVEILKILKRVWKFNVNVSIPTRERYRVTGRLEIKLQMYES